MLCYDICGFLSEITRIVTNKIIELWERLLELT